VAGGFEAGPLTRPTVALEHHTSVVFVSSVLRSHVKAFPRSAALPRNLRPHTKLGVAAHRLYRFSVVFTAVYRPLLSSLPRRRFRSVCSRVQPAARLQRRTRRALHVALCTACTPTRFLPEHEPAAALPAEQSSRKVAYSSCFARHAAASLRATGASAALPRARCIRKPPRGAHTIPSLKGFLQP
jgi:hypothetical protein